MTAYALGLAIGGPVLTALTIKLNERTILIGTVALVATPALIPSMPSTGGGAGSQAKCSFAGGRFADQNAARTLVAGSIGVATSLLVLYLAGAIPVLMALALLAFGLFSMGMVPSMQYRVVSLAGPGGQLASSLPVSAANVGVALGSYAGGAAIGAFPASSTVITGLIIAVIAIPAAWATSFLKPPAITDPAEPAAAPV